jgi:hypothetical protein
MGGRLAFLINARAHKVSNLFPRRPQLRRPREKLQSDTRARPFMIFFPRAFTAAFSPIAKYEPSVKFLFGERQKIDRISFPIISHLSQPVDRVSISQQTPEMRRSAVITLLESLHFSFYSQCGSC